MGLGIAWGFLIVRPDPAPDPRRLRYKDVHAPRDARPLGEMLGQSVLAAARNATPAAPGTYPAISVVSETLVLPRCATASRIAALKVQREGLMASLRGTFLDLKSFVPLLIQYELGGRYPLAPASRYLHERAMGREGLEKLDQENREHLREYIANVRAMEKISRIQTNLGLLEKHGRNAQAAAGTPLTATVSVVRLGEFTVVTFPGEISVEIGLALKKASPHHATYVACYSNGYLFYAPTEHQHCNTCAAQEDCDCMLGQGWLPIFEDRVMAMLKSV